MEVETPTLHAIAGGAAARPFITHHNALDIDLFLRIALELHLKRLLVGGIEKVYEIGRVFRNEGISRKHNPEFTMLELYQAYGDYAAMMDLTEGLIVACVDAPRRRHATVPYGERTIDFTPPWPRERTPTCSAKHVGVPIGRRRTPTVVRSSPAARRRRRPASTTTCWCTTCSSTWSSRTGQAGRAGVRPRLPGRAVPADEAQGGQPGDRRALRAVRHGMELANAYTELNDPITQEATFRQQLAGLPEEDSMAKMDDDFVRALRHGMPPAGGLGVGIDRLVMLLTNTQTIRDVILFPLLRPE